MAGPTVSDLLSTLRTRRKISPSDHTQLLANFDFFESRRSVIESTYRGKWVAALDEQLYEAPHFRELMAKLRSLPNHRFAYIEQL